MVVVPAGEFLMGAPVSEQSSDDDERPRHEVTFARPLYDKNTPNTAIGGKPQTPAG